MIRRPTVVYITILLAVLGVYLFLRAREQPEEEAAAPPEATEAVSYLFAAEAGSPTGIFLAARTGETVELSRNAENAWTLRQPIQTSAEQAASEAASSQVTTIRILEQIPEIDPGVVGLTEPEYTLTVRFSSGTERTVRVGVVTPTESGYYVQDAAGGDVWIVSKSSVDALLRLLASPPYLETPTPGLAPSETGPDPPAGTPPS